MPDHETAAAICLDIIHFLRVNFPYKNALLKAVYEDDIDPVSIIQVIKRNCNQIQPRNHFHYIYESQELLNLID